MEPKLLRVLATLGVPGVALGVFYLLLKQFEFKFEKIDATASAAIVVLFLVIVGLLTFYALRGRSSAMRIVNCTVLAQAQITKSGVKLRAGETAIVTARGAWAIWNDSRQCGPGGSREYIANSHNSPNGPWPVEGAPEGCLVVYRNSAVAGHFKNDDDAVYLTGPGQINFGPNDNFVSDNHGQVIATIMLS